MKDRKRIERLIRVRERIKEVRRIELAEATHRKNDAERHVEYRDGQRLEAIQKLISAQEIKASDMEQRAEDVAHAKDALVIAKLELHACDVEHQERREVMIQASLDVKTLEHIDEKLKRRADYEKSRREQITMDEAAARIFGGSE